MEIMDLVKKHPKGNIIRFGQSFMTPDLIKLPKITGKYTQRPNLINLFTRVNKYSIELMRGFGCKSCFGSHKKHVAMTKYL